MTDEKMIWDFLSLAIGNSYGVAGLMGNLFAESSLNPLCKTGGDKSLAGWQYAQMVDDGTIDIQEFAHDEIAFGLAQWRYWSRKEKLYQTWKDIQASDTTKNVSIGDLSVQLVHLREELPTYKTVWNTLRNATSVKEASDIVLLRYERPANTSDKVKEKRASFGQKYYDQYALYQEPTPQKLYVQTKVEKALVRRGNGKEYGILTRIEQKGTKLTFVARSDNNWFAIEEPNTKKPRFVGWISGEVAEAVLE